MQQNDFVITGNSYLFQITCFFSCLVIGPTKVSIMTDIDHLVFDKQNHGEIVCNNLCYDKPIVVVVEFISTVQHIYMYT